MEETEKKATAPRKLKRIESEPAKAKRKKIEKEVSVEKYKCFHCKRTMDDTEFYKSYSICYDLIPVCKNCLIKIFNKLMVEYKDDRFKSMLVLCEKFDIIYNKKRISTLNQKYPNKEDNATVVKEYMKTVNSLYSGKCYRDSELIETAENKSESSMTDDSVVWGSKYKVEEYRLLNEIYEMYLADNPNMKAIQKQQLRDVCKLDLLLRDINPEKDSDRLSKLQKSKGDILKLVGLDNASLMKYGGTEATKLEQDFTMWIADIETKSPAEFVEDQDMFKDMHQMSKDYNELFVKSMYKTLYGEREFPDIKGNKR